MSSATHETAPTQSVKAMNELLMKVLDAHGGQVRWRSYNKVEATIVSGGGFFPLKGVHIALSYKT